MMPWAHARAVAWPLLLTSDVIDMLTDIGTLWYRGSHRHPALSQTRDNGLRIRANQVK
jgi:hypothetical protein